MSIIDTIDYVKTFKDSTTAEAVAKTLTQLVEFEASSEMISGAIHIIRLRNHVTVHVRFQATKPVDEPQPSTAPKQDK